MIKPVIQKKPYKPEIGDILSGGEYLLKKVGSKDKLGDVIFACAADRNPWESLKKTDIDIDPLKKAFKYECPYTGNIFYHFIPAAIVIKSDVKVYRKTPLDDKDYDFMFDLDWVKNILKDHHPELDEISQSMLGHGYTYGTLPTDGIGGWIEVLIELDNGDCLFGICWEWYNK
jgi:hypothetical protein